MRNFIIFSFFCCFLSNMLMAQTNFVFGVKPGFTLNSAYLGINQNSFTPFLGVDLFWISADGNYQKTHENYQSATTYRKEITTIDFTGKAFLLIPQLGLKYSFGKNNVKPYISTAVFIGLPLAELNVDGTKETWEFADNELISHEQESVIDNFHAIENTVNEALGFWGLVFGAGAEYFFDPHFSIGGEYGVRLLFDRATYEDTSGDLDPVALAGYRNKWQSKVKASLKVSYAVVSVNFYF